MSAVPVWLWIVAMNLLAVAWFSTGEVKELQCESKRATLLVRGLVVLCACVLGSLFWLGTVLGAQLRRQGLAGRPPEPEPEPESDEAIRRAVNRLRRDQLIEEPDHVYVMTDADREVLAGLEAHYANKDNPFADVPYSRLPHRAEIAAHIADEQARLRLRTAQAIGRNA